MWVVNGGAKREKNKETNDLSNLSLERHNFGGFPL
jgi:hypothetical protein